MRVRSTYWAEIIMSDIFNKRACLSHYEVKGAVKERVLGRYPGADMLHMPRRDMRAPSYSAY